MRRILRFPGRRTWISGVLALALVGATAKVAQACFFECVLTFGLIAVDNGEVYYYNGCTETSADGERYITCYYTNVFN
jgi:hypothetical protein